MKKSAVILIFILILFSCEKAEETINIIDELNDKMPREDYSRFAAYTDYLAIPDFLTEQQADLYKKAAILHYIFNCEAAELDSIPLLEEQTVGRGDPDAPQNNSGVPQNDSAILWLDGAEYGQSAGRYRKYADFEELCLSVFTREFFEELNKNKKFIEQDGNLYILTGTEIVQMSLDYAPWHEPDKFELISSGETEIKFNVTGYYFEELTNNIKSEGDAGTSAYDGEITSLFVEIILTRTEAGWRFSQFATAGNPYTFKNNIN